MTRSQKMLVKRPDLRNFLEFLQHGFGCGHAGSARALSAIFVRPCAMACYGAGAPVFRTTGRTASLKDLYTGAAYSSHKTQTMASEQLPGPRAEDIINCRGPGPTLATTCSYLAPFWLTRSAAQPPSRSAARAASADGSNWDP